jgi:hypothetical protein
MQGMGMGTFIPLHLTGLERCDLLLPWLQSWLPSPSTEPHAPVDWFERGHGIVGGAYHADGLWYPMLGEEEGLLWALVPGAASAAVDELQCSQHKQTHLNHIFVCPWLMTQYWRVKLHKVSDLVKEIPTPI